MTGPDYPPDPITGSNAIGSFTIGVSPIGDIPAFDVWTTIISQYANSSRLTAIIEAFTAAMDQTENLDDFYDMVWNVATAQGWGLDVWGRIVGVSRTLELVTGTYFGFEEATAPQVAGFNQAPFYTGNTSTSNFVLADSDYRQLILAKAFSNICDGSIIALNQLISTLFQGYGTAYVVDGENMTMTWTFSWVLTPLQQAIVENSGALPRPNGVKVLYSIP